MMVERAVQSGVVRTGEQSLVVLVLICASVLMPTQTKIHTATLVKHTNLLQDINLALDKPKLCWRAASTSLQQRSKYSRDRTSK